MSDTHRAHLHTDRYLARARTRSRLRAAEERGDKTPKAHRKYARQALRAEWPAAAQH